MNDIHNIRAIQGIRQQHISLEGDVNTKRFVQNSHIKEKMEQFEREAPVVSFQDGEVKTPNAIKWYVDRRHRIFPHLHFID